MRIPTEGLEPASPCVCSAHTRGLPGKGGEDLEQSLPVGSLDPCQAARPPLYRRGVLLVSHHWRPPPDTLASLRSERPGTPRARRRLTSPFGIGLIAMRIPGLTPQERRGTSSVRFSPRFLPVTPPSTRRVTRGESPTPRTEVEKENQPQRFRRVRTLAHTAGRNVAPPGVSRPGHFNAALTGRPWLPPPPEESSSRDCCTGTNPHREDLVHRTSPFET
jgi:hypothetical protein